MSSKCLMGSCGAILLVFSLALGGSSASAQVLIVDMDFDGPTGLENAGAGPAGILKGGASINSTAGISGSGALVLDGSNEPEPTGAGLDLAIGDFGVFTGLGDFNVAFDFATIGGDSGALFSADGAHVFGEDCDGCPGDQAGGLNVFLEGDFGVVADLWFIAGLDFEGQFNDDAFHHLEVSYDATLAELSLSVDGGEPSILEVDDGEGFERDTSMDLTRLGDENNPDFGFEFNDGCNCKFDNLIIEGPAPPPVRLTVDRTTGDLDLEVLSTDPVNIDSLTIESAAGTLVPGNYTGLSGTGGEFADWTITTAEAEEIGESGSEATVTNGETFSLGDAVWQPFFDEDLSVIVNDTGLGASVKGVIEYVGGEPLLFADLDLNNTVDTADYEIFRDSFGTDTSEMTFFDAYLLADLDGSGGHNFDDWILFIEAFDEFNGEGAFVAMIGGVPEPASLLMFVLGLAGLVAARRRRASLVLMCCVAFTLSFAAKSQATTLVEYLFDSDFSDTSGNNFNGTPNPDGLSNPTVSGGKLQLSGDIEESLVVPLGAANNPFDGLTDFTIEMNVASMGGFNNAGVVLLGSANSAEPDNEDNQSFSIFIEPQEEEDGETFGGSLVADYWFVNEVRVDDALLLDGNEHSIKVSYQAPEEPENEEGEPNPGTMFLNVDGDWLGINPDFDPRPAAPHDLVLIGSTPNLEFPFECEEGECFTAELNGTVDNFRILTQDDVDIPTQLRAEVDLSDGGVSILGGEFEREIKYYEINSEAGSLVAGQLNGLSDKNIDPEGEGTGETWDVLNASDSQIAEAFLLGSSVFSATENSSISLGNIFNSFGAQDLEVIAVTSDNEDIELAVSYMGMIPEGLPGDYNNDGAVNAADYAVWRDNLGTTFDLPNRDPAASGAISQSDYDFWRSNYGNTLGASGSAVPEPSSMMLLIASALAVMTTGRSYFESN